MTKAKETKPATKAKPKKVEVVEEPVVGLIIDGPEDAVAVDEPVAEAPKGKFVPALHEVCRRGDDLVTVESWEPLVIKRHFVRDFVRQDEVIEADELGEVTPVDKDVAFRELA